MSDGSDDSKSRMQAAAGALAYAAYILESCALVDVDGVWGLERPDGSRVAELYKV